MLYYVLKLTQNLEETEIKVGLSVREVCSFPIAAVICYQKLNDLKQHKFILSGGQRSTQG